MKRTTAVPKAPMLCLVLAALFLSHATIARATTPSTAQQNQQQAADAPTNATQFVGKIVSLNGTRYILRDDANDTWYHLDDQKSAGKFCGKIVAITGTLDGRFDMIHIHSIQESKG